MLVIGETSIISTKPNPVLRVFQDSENGVVGKPVKIIISRKFIAIVNRNTSVSGNPQQALLVKVKIINFGTGEPRIRIKKYMEGILAKNTDREK